MTIIGPLLFGHVWVPVCLQDYFSMGGYGEDQGFLVHTTFRLIYLWMVDYYADRLLDLYNTKTQLTKEHLPIQDSLALACLRPTYILLSLSVVVVGPVVLGLCAIREWLNIMVNCHLSIGQYSVVC